MNAERPAPPPRLRAAAEGLARRASLAVARAGGDNLALALLAAGAVAGGAAWLLARRRRP